MFAQRSKEQRPIILHPKITSVLYEITKALTAFVQRICRFQVFRAKPLLISASDRGVYYGTFVFNP
jgi:hypothetical protein